MKLTKEQIALKREFITKGMIITSDCAVTTPFAPRLESPLDEAAQRMGRAREMAKQLAAALCRSRS